jgi:hypothetical protein
MKCVALVELVALAALLVTGGAIQIINQHQGYCLAAVGTKEEHLSLVMTQACNKTDAKQSWTYDEISGNICSVSLGTCLQEMILGSPLSFKPDRFAVVLGHTLSSAVLAFDYNSAALSLCLRGRNRSCTLGGYDDQTKQPHLYHVRWT